MAELRRGHEVSCLALTFFYDYLETHGHSRKVLQERLPYPPEYLDQRTNWIDYGTFLEIERRMSALFPDDPDLFFNIGRTFGATRGFGFLRVLFRAVVSPLQLYSQLQRLVGRFLFPFVTIHFERVDPGAIRGTYTFAPGYPPSQPFLDVVSGILTGIPSMMGAAPAQVSQTRLSPLVVQFDIRLDRQGGTLDAVKTLRRRMMKTGRMWWRNLTDVVNELEETNQLLQEKVDALTEAKGEVDRNMRDLSMLHALVHAGTSEREPGPLLGKVVSLLSHELGGIPAAVFLPEGDPPQSVLAASAMLKLRDQEALVSAPQMKASLTGERGTLELGGRVLQLLPMTTGERIVGTLVLANAEQARAPHFFETIASEVAVLLDNALAFRTIADLRDNLEMRVHERTAELEDAREQLEDTVKRLQESDRSRNAFFTNVSHELRTPLTLILAPLDAIEERLRGAGVPVTDDLRSIRRNAQVLLRHINEILDFARLDAHRMQVSPESVDLHALLGEVVEALGPLARQKEVELTHERGPETLWVQLDPRLGRRVFGNLVENAIKYIDPGDSVTLSARTLGGFVEIRVADTGPGIPAESRERIFGRFERVPDSRGRIIEGSGLGLAMVREIVERHHGTVELKESGGRGATFGVTLPRAQPGEQRRATDGELLELAPFGADFGPETAREESEVPLSEGAGGGSRILLVEDNVEMRRFLSRLLGAHFRLIWAENGEEGLARARQELPELILSDVMMPKMDGYALCRELKADPLTRNIPVVLISARHGTDAALEGFHAGADDYIVKPFSAPELLARLNAQLRLRAMTLTLLRMEKQSTLGTLSAGIAHEVLNPINAVINAMPALRKTLKTTNVGRDSEVLMDTVERGGQRVKDVVQTLLALSRQPDAKPALREVPLTSAIEPVLALLKHRLGGRVQLHREFEWDGALLCSPELLGQIVLNLVSNAIDALPPEGGNIWVHTGLVDGTVQVSVRDDGPGIPPELREHIFEAFFTTKPPGSGTGLGLALSREFAQLQGAELSVEASDRGAVFLLSMPLRRERSNHAELST